MGWGEVDKVGDEREVIRKVRDLLRPPMTTYEREEALRLCNEALAR